MVSQISNKSDDLCAGWIRSVSWTIWSRPCVTKFQMTDFLWHHSIWPSCMMTQIHSTVFTHLIPRRYGLFLCPPNTPHVHINFQQMVSQIASPLALRPFHAIHSTFLPHRQPAPIRPSLMESHTDRSPNQNFLIGFHLPRLPRTLQTSMFGPITTSEDLWAGCVNIATPMKTWSQK